MDSGLKQYIPAGCLRVDADDNDLPPVVGSLPSSMGWHFFARGDEPVIDRDECLTDATQKAILGSRILAPFADLLSARWIQLSFRRGIIRVYIFPHDVDRRAIVRAGDVKLCKTLARLLKQLDYSPDTWAGSTEGLPWRIPASGPDGDHGEDEDCSLLERFNQLPSPDPKLGLVTPDSFNAIAMQGILDSKLHGLHTTLYAHQRRSAAVMLQKEVEPGRVVDPRLRFALDHNKQPWYFDADAGLILREPRYYDGVSGGILAEEMGTGKTLICLAVIIATKHLPTEAPDALTVKIPTRPKVGSLVDMAAATVNRYSFPWKGFLASSRSEPGEYIEGCVKALESSENRACYELGNPLVETRKGGRITAPSRPAEKIHLSSTTLIIVPNNLVTQWHQEITKHTSGLKVLTMTDSLASIPPVSVLLGYDIILFSQARFENVERTRSGLVGRSTLTHCPLDHIRFKRCIIDEGHKLGSSRGSAWKSDLLRGLERLHLAARWVVTGTPSRGLYGTGKHETLQQANQQDRLAEEFRAINNQERDDLHRIGSIATKFLKVRPWSNTREEVGDTPANWNVYVMQPRHHNKSSGRVDCLKATLESLIIRNRLSDVSHHLPPVDEKIVVLDGSFQDKLSLNLFSMMIIFNSVQSQRTDQDYFFHSRQRKNLDQLVSNLKQASFFGGVFFSAHDIQKSLGTAEDFLKEKKVTMSPEDHDLIRAAIAFGKLAVENQLKAVSSQYHSMPLYIEDFPGGNGKHWSLDDMDTETNGPVCTDASLIQQLQKFLNPCIDAPTSLQVMIENGQLAWQGNIARERAAKEAAEASGDQAGSNAQSALAGNTSQGVDRHTIRKINMPSEQTTPEASMETATTNSNIEIAEPLAKTRIISTVSAKLSYLIDSIVKYQDEEQIIVFYENDNVAWYLAGMLEILQIQHLIYTRKGLDSKRRAQYVSTFTHNPKFRVLLMDISQAAFGLDMRSASRIYFISPVLNPQVEAQAIGRARRISQQKPVTVETLVLRDSIEEVMVERRRHMTQAEHRKVKNILDDKPMHDWILNAKIIPLPDVEDNVAQTARLKAPQFVFGRGFGRESDPDADLIMESPAAKRKEREVEVAAGTQRLPAPLRLGGLKRSRTLTPAPGTGADGAELEAAPVAKKKKTVRVAFADDA
ncbi:putative P-loop containing nucleoside triphosphate hydrolase protein [Seiridium cardinale]